jgi:hypothetical protein
MDDGWLYRSIQTKCVPQQNGEFLESIQNGQLITTSSSALLQINTFSFFLCQLLCHTYLQYDCVVWMDDGWLYRSIQTKCVPQQQNGEFFWRVYSTERSADHNQLFCSLFSTHTGVFFLSFFASFFATLTVV